MVTLHRTEPRDPCRTAPTPADRDVLFRRMEVIAGSYAYTQISIRPVMW
jgi:hypothetical protein